MKDTILMDTPWIFMTMKKIQIIRCLMHRIALSLIKHWKGCVIWKTFINHRSDENCQLIRRTPEDESHMNPEEIKSNIISKRSPNKMIVCYMFCFKSSVSIVVEIDFDREQLSTILKENCWSRKIFAQNWREN